LDAEVEASVKYSVELDEGGNVMTSVAMKVGAFVVPTIRISVGGKVGVGVGTGVTGAAVDGELVVGDSVTISFSHSHPQLS
jgi:hypothetical protein